jgi:hypothetical protein
MIDNLSGDNEGLSAQGKQLLKGEHVNYIDSFFKDKTKEEIEELTEYFTEEAHRFAFGYPATFENMVFIYLVAIFDAFFEDITETILIHVPQMLEITNSLNREEQIQKELRKFSGRLANQVGYWKSRFNIAIEDSGVEFDSINIVFEKRHVLVHRNGTVDDKFFRNTGSRDYVNGDKIRIEPKYFYESLDQLKSVATYLVREVVAKYC